jgi:hypothetical protein
MTRLEATGLYWRCSRTLRGHCFGTPIRAEIQLSTIAALELGRLSTLAMFNSQSTFAKDKQASVLPFKGGANGHA